MTPNLSQINSKLRASAKRSHQNVSKVPSELKNAARAVARLKVQVASLERLVRNSKGAKKI